MIKSLFYNCWSAESFLKELNEAFGHESQELVYAQETDFVIVSFCAQEIGWNENHHKWLRNAVEHCPILWGGKNILLFAQCCGPYSDYAKVGLRQMFPGYNLIMPDIATYFSSMRDVAGRLLEVGVVKVKQA